MYLNKHKVFIFHFPFRHTVASVLTGVVALWSFAGLYAQSSNVADPLAAARQLRATGHLRQAEKLLEPWCAAHPHDINAFWLRGQNEYWRKNFRKTRQYYQKALSLDPQNLYLQLDYAEAQLGMGRFRQAGKYLDYLAEGAGNDPHFQYVRALEYYWTGDLKMAAAQAKKAQKAGSKKAADLLREIAQARALWVQAGGHYATDSQPLESAAIAVETGAYRDKWLDLTFKTTGQQFLKDSMAFNAWHFEVGNRFHFPKTGTIFEANIGVFRLNNYRSQSMANWGLEQRLPGHLSLSLKAGRKPYLLTRTSLDTSIFFRHLQGEINWQEPHGWWLQAGAQTDIFEDQNAVSTVWGWILTPKLNIGPVSLRTGYAYSYSDARESRLFSTKTLDELKANWDSTARIPDVYKPYFTPENMETHAALALLDWQVSKNIALNIHGKYGFWASAQTPYLYLGAAAADTVTIRRQFQPTTFTPLELGAKLSLRLSKNANISLSYLFSRNLFYELQTTDLRVKVAF